MEDYEDCQDTPPETPIEQQAEEVRISVEIGNILNDVSSISGYMGAETPSMQRSRLTNENMMESINNQNNMTKVQLNRLLQTPEIGDVNDTRLKSEARDRQNATLVNRQVLINNMMNDVE